MTIYFEDIFGATPLSLDDMQGLKLGYVTTQAELNRVEQNNIKKRSCLNITFAFELHKKMFGNVWVWAGQQRVSDKNIGVPWSQITTQLDTLFKNSKYWIDNKIYTLTEVGARVHHKLVYIHPFANGNGRHARRFTDILLEQNYESPFSWGSKALKENDLGQPNEIRKKYIRALQEADNKNFSPLIDFVTS